jgi:hypothetical protein
MLAFGAPVLETKPVLLSLAEFSPMGVWGSKRRVTGVAGVTVDIN